MSDDKNDSADSKIIIYSATWCAFCHAKVILTVGLRQPRWPECHAPGWADINQPNDQWQPQLNNFMLAER